MSDSDDSVTELQEESDKAEVIQYFSTNYAKVITNFQQYCEIRNHMSSLVMKMNAFENKIDVITINAFRKLRKAISMIYVKLAIKQTSLLILPSCRTC